MAGKPTTTAEEREEIMNQLRLGVNPSIIASTMGKTYECVRWIAVKNKIPYKKMYKEKVTTRHVNLEARNDGSGYY